MTTNHHLTLDDVRKLTEPVKRVRDGNIGMTGKTLLKLANGGACKNGVVASHEKAGPIITELDCTGRRVARTTLQRNLKNIRVRFHGCVRVADDPSSATAATRRADCNRDGPPALDVMLG